MCDVLITAIIYYLCNQQQSRIYDHSVCELHCTPHLQRLHKNKHSTPQQQEWENKQRTLFIHQGWWERKGRKTLHTKLSAGGQKYHTHDTKEPQRAKPSKTSRWTLVFTKCFPTKLHLGIRSVRFWHMLFVRRKKNARLKKLQNQPEIKWLGAWKTDYCAKKTKNFKTLLILHDFGDLKEKHPQSLRSDSRIILTCGHRGLFSFPTEFTPNEAEPLKVQVCVESGFPGHLTYPVNDPSSIPSKFQQIPLDSTHSLSHCGSFSLQFCSYKVHAGPFTVWGWVVKWTNSKLTHTRTLLWLEFFSFLSSFSPTSVSPGSPPSQCSSPAPRPEAAHQPCTLEWLLSVCMWGCVCCVSEWMASALSCSLPAGYSPPPDSSSFSLAANYKKLGVPRRAAWAPSFLADP